MIRFLKGFGQFWYDFIIGDDWKIAAAVVIALGVTLALLLADALNTTAATVFGGVAVVIAFVASMVIDIRRSSPPVKGPVGMVRPAPKRPGSTVGT